MVSSDQSQKHPMNLHAFSSKSAVRTSFCQHPSNDAVTECQVFSKHDRNYLCELSLYPPINPSFSFVHVMGFSCNIEVVKSGIAAITFYLYTGYGCSLGFPSKGSPYPSSGAGSDFFQFSLPIF